MIEGWIHTTKNQISNYLLKKSKINLLFFLFWKKDQSIVESSIYGRKKKLFYFKLKCADDKMSKEI